MNKGKGIQRSVRAYWEQEDRLAVESTVWCDGKLSVRHLEVLVKGGLCDHMGAGRGDVVYGPSEKELGEGVGSGYWDLQRNEIAISGNGILGAPPGWRLVKRALPSAMGGDIEGATVDVRHSDGRVFEDGDVVTSAGAIVLGPASNPRGYTPAGPAYALFRR